MKILFVLIVLMFDCLVSQAYAQQLDSALENFSKGCAKMTLKDFDGAIRYFDKYLEIEKSQGGYFIRAEAKYKLKDFKGALQDFESGEEYVRDYESCNTGYELYGDLQCKLNDFSGALTSYKKLNNCWYTFDSSTHARVFSKLGYVKFMLKDYKGAVINYALSVVYDSSIAERYKNMEWNSKISDGCLCILDNFRKEIESFTENSHSEGAILTFNQKSLPDEIEKFNFTNPDYKRTLVSFIDIIYKNSDFYDMFNGPILDKNSQECYRVVANALVKTIGMIKKLEQEESVFDIGLAKHCLEDYNGALKDLTAAIESEPNNINFYFFRVRTKVKLSDFQGAINDLDTLLKLGVNCFVERGELKDSLHDYEGALLDFSKAIQRDTYDRKAYWKRGNLMYKLNNFRGAIGDYSKYIELDSEQASVFISRGLAKQALFDYRGAISDFTSAITLNPKETSYYNHRALAKYQIKDTDGACLDWSKAGELGDEKAYDMIRKYCQ